MGKLIFFILTFFNNLAFGFLLQKHWRKLSVEKNVKARDTNKSAPPSSLAYPQYLVGDACLFSSMYHPVPSMCLY